MVFYQVLIEIEERKKGTTSNNKIYELDKVSKEEIIDDIIKPYLKKEEFLFNGYFVSNKNIKRIIVKTTENSIKVYSEYENNNMPEGLLIYVSPEDIVEYDKYTKDITKELFKEVMRNIKNDSDCNMLNDNDDIKVDENKVFIVHGRDELAKIEVARFIENLGLTPIILHEQASFGNTIIEKIEKYSNVKFAIVLYTPCDLGCVSDDVEHLQPRARQNVVFEHGYLIGKVGRKNVCALVKGELEKPNDISGVVYINMDNNNGWKLQVAKEMKEIGYNIDMNCLI